MDVTLFFCIYIIGAACSVFRNFDSICLVTIHLYMEIAKEFEGYSETSNTSIQSWFLGPGANHMIPLVCEPAQDASFTTSCVVLKQETATLTESPT